MEFTIIIFTRTTRSLDLLAFKTKEIDSSVLENFLLFKLCEMLSALFMK